MHKQIPEKQNSLISPQLLVQFHQADWELITTRQAFASKQPEINTIHAFAATSPILQPIPTSNSSRGFSFERLERNSQCITRSDWFSRPCLDRWDNCSVITPCLRPRHHQHQRYTENLAHIPNCLIRNRVLARIRITSAAPWQIEWWVSADKPA
jgi:hypothetical protein